MPGIASDRGHTRPLFLSVKKREWVPTSALEFFHFFDFGYLLHTVALTHTHPLNGSHTLKEDTDMTLEARLNEFDARLNSLQSQVTARTTPARTTRLKMRVNSVTEDGNPGNPLTHLGCAAVCSQDAANENSVFGKYTPCGNLSFSVIPEVANQFKVGDEIYLDLSLAPQR